MFDFIRLYVVAPLTALKMKLDAEMVLLKDKLSKFEIPYIKIGSDPSIYNPSSWFEFGSWKPFEGMKVSDAELNQAKATSEKPVSELIADEMSKMQANIEADKATKEAADLAKQLQQKQIENLLAN